MSVCSRYILPPIVFGGKYYISSDRAIQKGYISSDLHEKNIETVTTRVFYLKLKENNENDMAAHAFFFLFLLPPTAKQNQAEQLLRVCCHSHKN